MINFADLLRFHRFILCETLEVCSGFQRLSIDFAVKIDTNLEKGIVWKLFIQEKILEIFAHFSSSDALQSFKSGESFSTAIFYGIVVIYSIHERRKEGR